MARAELRAYAKVNLALGLAPPEPPGSALAGWHRICTWMCAIDLADDVLVESLEPGAASTWSCAWAPDALRPAAVDWPVERDLAWRALGAVERHVGRRLPTRIAVHKRIPAGAGLGGGSADGAAALVGIDRAWGLGLGPGALRTIGATLGSDVPFFIDDREPPRPALVGGFGEAIERVGRVEGEVVLVSPPVSCPTGAVYRAFDETAPGPMREREVRALGGAGSVSGELFNDLAGAAVRVRPALRRVREAVSAAAGRPVHVTGSGSALFIACGRGEGEVLAERVRGAARGAMGGTAVRVCTLR